jgi:hypothetical protein
MKKESKEESRQFWIMAVIAFGIGILIKIFIVNEYGPDFLRFLMSKFPL